MASKRRGRAPAVLAARSPLLLRFFGRLFERDLKRSFHAVRCSGDVPTGDGPLVVYANHPSWWDGEIFIWLNATMFAGRRSFTPIEAAMLERYRFFGKLGGFGVAPGYAGAATFLEVGGAVLELNNGLLLVNAEGRFRDARDRPLEIAPGLAHLAKRRPEARFVPMAIEYSFWDERRPNLLLRFGDAVPPDAIRDTCTMALTAALGATMDVLAADARSRDPSRFTTLLAGRTAINPFFDGWRGAKAGLAGRRFDPAHRAGPDHLKP